MAYTGCGNVRFADENDGTFSWQTAGDVTGWDVANKIIISLDVQELVAHTPASTTLNVQWRNITDSGSWTDLAATGEMKIATTTGYADGDTISSAQGTGCATGSFQSGDSFKDETGSNAFQMSSKNNWTETWWCADPAGAPANKEYEYRIYDQGQATALTPGTNYTLTTAATAETKTVTSDLDAYLKETGTKEADLDAVLISRVTKDTDLDALLKGTETETVDLDALLKKTLTRTSDLDAILVSTKELTADLDAVLNQKVLSTADLDALIKGAVERTTDLDSYLKQAITRSAFLDAYLKKTGTKDADLDAILTQEGSVTADLDGLLIQAVQKQQTWTPSWSGSTRWTI